MLEQPGYGQKPYDAANEAAQPVPHVLRPDPQMLSYTTLTKQGTPNIRGNDPAIIHEIHHDFTTAEQYRARIGGPLGDTVLQVEELAGVAACIRAHRPDNPKITIEVPEPLFELYAGLSDGAHNTEVIVEHDPGNTDLAALASDPKSRGGTFVLDFRASPEGNVLASVPRGRKVIDEATGNSITEVSGLVGNHMLQMWHGSGPGRGAYLANLLGLPADAIPESTVRAQIPLPPDSAARYDRLAQELGIDPTAVQVGFAMQTNISLKLYDLANWRATMDELASLFNQQYPGQRVNYNVFVGPTSFKHFERKDIEEMLGQGFTATNPNVTYTIIEKPIADVAVLLQQDDLTVGLDTGLLHIASHVEGGNTALGLFLPEGSKKEGWITTERYRGITAPPAPNNATTSPAQRSARTLRPTTIDNIPPTQIAHEAFAMLQTSEKLQHTE